MEHIKHSPSRGPGSPDVTGFYEPDTGSIQYVVSDPGTGDAAVIDIVQGFDPKNVGTDTEAADRIIRHIRDKGLRVKWVLDTHPHADHLMASLYLKEALDAPNAIGEKVAEVSGLWRDLYHLPDAFDIARDFDHLLADGDTLRLGELEVAVMLCPGHTLASISYVVGDAAFVHDTFMQPDVGTARADFPGGDAGVLFDSLQRILTLPDDTRLFVGHDYGTEDRAEPAWESTVAEQRCDNAHIGGGVSRSAYIEKREKRDATLVLPDRMLHVLQMNLRAGRLPPEEVDGHSYLKIPLNRF